MVRVSDLRHEMRDGAWITVAPERPLEVAIPYPCFTACIAALCVVAVEAGSVPPRSEVDDQGAEGDEAGGDEVHAGFGDGPDG